MNDLVRRVQPQILFNGRNGLAGDFATPEGHLAAPKPWRPWEACISLNDSWGFHAGDCNWKNAGQVIDFLATCAAGQGNLLLNIGPRGDGEVPAAAARVLEEVGNWLRRCGEAVFDTDLLTSDAGARNVGGEGDGRGDWCHHGPLTSRGNHLYLLLRRWPGAQLTLGGLQCAVREASLLGSEHALAFTQNAGRLMVGLPPAPPGELCPVLRLTCESAPQIYGCGGLQTPRVPHPRYDPCPSEINW